MSSIETIDLEQDDPQGDTAGMARFLGQHFGGGLVYLQEPADAGLLGLARRLRLVDAEGYLTDRGKHLWLQSLA